MALEHDSSWLETGQGEVGLSLDALMIWWRSLRYYESSQNADILRSVTRGLHAVRLIVRLDLYFNIERHPRWAVTMGLLERTF